MVESDRDLRSRGRPWAPVPEKDRRHYRGFGLVETRTGPPDPVVKLHTDPRPAGRRPAGLLDYLRKLCARDGR